MLRACYMAYNACRLVPSGVHARQHRRSTFLPGKKILTALLWPFVCRCQVPCPWMLAPTAGHSPLSACGYSKFMMSWVLCTSSPRQWSSTCSESRLATFHRMGITTGRMLLMSPCKCMLYFRIALSFRQCHVKQKVAYSLPALWLLPFTTSCTLAQTTSKFSERSAVIFIFPIGQRKKCKSAVWFYS